MNLNRKGSKVFQCTCCGAAYEQYKVEDQDSDIFGYWCEVTSGAQERKGVCGFCNQKSIWYNHKPTHVKETCRI